MSFPAKQWTARFEPSGPHRWDGYIPSPSAQNHAANLARLPGGELACVWFGGTMEGMPDISIHMSVFDEAEGRVVARDQIVTDDPARSEQNPLLHTAADGAVWLLYTSQIAGNQETSIVRRRISLDGGKRFRSAAYADRDVPGDLHPPAHRDASLRRNAAAGLPMPQGARRNLDGKP